MRKISKENPPPALTEWIAANKKGPNCNYNSVGGELRKVIREALITEQGGLCAYTGRKMDVDSCHIEHLKPQQHCIDLEDVAYKNLVAAVPQPNTPKLPYGAHLKDNWPSPGESDLFVSPLSTGCSDRFSFNFKGEVQPKNPEDEAAATTIARLGLDHDILVSYRRSAIRGTINVRGKMLDVKSARRRLDGLTEKETTSRDLEQFSFAIIDALKKHIARLQKVSGKKKP